MSTATPKVGFVSLGCPKATVDSERILTQLRMEGYEIVPTYEDADVVVVNTCGFIDSAKAESLEVIGEAIAENGKVIVTGCMGVDEGNIRNVHPSVLSVTGPQQYEQVVNAVHEVIPPKAMFGRSWLYIHIQLVAYSLTSSVSARRTPYLTASAA